MATKDDEKPLAEARRILDDQWGGSIIEEEQKEYEEIY